MYYSKTVLKNLLARDVNPLVYGEEQSYACNPTNAVGSIASDSLFEESFAAIFKLVEGTILYSMKYFYSENHCYRKKTYA